MKRTQIYLDESQDQRLERRARSEGKTKSALIREAVDDYLGRRSRKAEVKAHLDDSFGALPNIEVPARGEWDRGYG